jgi:hypothetical protein
MNQIGITEIIITITTTKMYPTKINIMIKDTVNKSLIGTNKTTLNKNIKTTISKNTKIITKLIHRQSTKIIIITRREQKSSIKMNHRIRQIIIKIKHKLKASKLNNKSTHNSPNLISSRKKKAISLKRIILMAAKIRIRNEAYIL